MASRDRWYLGATWEARKIRRSCLIYWPRGQDSRQSSFWSKYRELKSDGSSVCKGNSAEVVTYVKRVKSRCSSEYWPWPRQRSGRKHKYTLSVAPISDSCCFCNFNHALEDCRSLRSRPQQEHIQFLASKSLCFWCLFDKHVAKSCPQRKASKFANCPKRYSTVLHT